MAPAFCRSVHAIESECLASKPLCLPWPSYAGQTLRLVEAIRASSVCSRPTATISSAAESAPASASATPVARCTAVTRTTTVSGTSRAVPWPVTVIVRMRLDRDAERLEDLQGRPRSVEGEEVQAGSAELEHLLAQLGGDLHAHVADVGRVLEALEPRGQLVGQFGTGQLGHPGDLSEVRDRHDAGQDRDVAAEGAYPLDQVGVVGGPEEQL